MNYIYIRSHEEINGRCLRKQRPSNELSTSVSDCAKCK